MRNQVLVVVITGLTLLAWSALAEDIESFTIKPEDVTKASVGFARDGSVYLEGVFTKAKATEFTAATERNLNKKIRLVINGKVVSEPLVHARITGGSFIFECKTTDEAVALAKDLMQKIPNPKASEAICATDKTVRLTDGRGFTTDMLVNDGQRLQFKVKGWEYNLPAYMIATGTLAELVKVQRVEITKDSIFTPEGKPTNFQELMTFLDKRATRPSPVILVLPDAVSWPETRRQEFGAAYGETQTRPNVGIEALWPKKWLPGDPGRELPKK